MLRPLIALVVVATATVASATPPVPVRSQSFDLDANVIHMSTKLYVKTPSGGEVAMPMALWEGRAHKLATNPRSKYFGYHLGQGSYRDMGDQPGLNPFVRDLEKTLTRRNFKGPAWRAFVKQLSTPEGARRASIITAREHSAASIYAGLELLRAQGLIEYLPPIENLFGVNAPHFAVDGKVVTGPTPERKLAVQKSVLDKLEVDAQDHAGRRQVWHFTDDNWDNYTATSKGLAPLVASGRWPSVDVVVHYTGTDHPRELVKLVPPRI